VDRAGCMIRPGVARRFEVSLPRIHFPLSGQSDLPGWPDWPAVIGIHANLTPVQGFAAGQGGRCI